MYHLLLYTVREEGNKLTFVINKGEGDVSVSPEKRTYVIKFKDITAADVAVTVGGRKVNAELLRDGKTVELVVSAKTTAKVEVTLENCTVLKNEDKKQALTTVISKFQMSTDYKGLLFSSFMKDGKIPSRISKNFTGPIEEILKLD